MLIIISLLHGILIMILAAAAQLVGLWVAKWLVGYVDIHRVLPWLKAYLWIGVTGLFGLICYLHGQHVGTTTTYESLASSLNTCMGIIAKEGPKQKGNHCEYHKH